MARLVFFSHKKQYLEWMKGRLHQGAVVVIAGTPSVFNDQLQFTHPEVLTVAVRTTSRYKFVLKENQPFDSANAKLCEPGSARHDVETVEEGLTRVCRPRPVYHASSRISSEHIHDSILGFLRLLAECDDEIPAPNVSESVPGEAGVNVSESGNVTVPGGAAPNVSGSGKDAASDETNALDSAEDRARLLAGLARAIPDILPEPIRADRGLMHRAEAFLNIHNPISTKDFHRAIATLRYEEAFICQTALLQARAHASHSTAEPCPDTALRDAMIASLPFDLTDGQREVIDIIAADMEKDRPMQRLLQGEVGSGKTVVALAAMLQAVGSGRQAVLVAPTQVLAEQHHRTLSDMMGRLAEHVEGETVPPVILLTGGMKLAARRRALAAAASGEPCIVVATHAAFSKHFQAPNLALAVIDEQHRFGVEQRESLRGKSLSGKAPHLLFMTATPIPRTAAMTWFGDLDLSWLSELPGGRKPIRTFVIPESDGRLMGSMFAHIRQRIDAGERAYVVCARIDESDETADVDLLDDVDSVSAVSSTAPGGVPRVRCTRWCRSPSGWKKLPQFAGVRFATLTGRDDDTTKQQVMAGFTNGETPVLVSTTVIEVGVDAAGQLHGGVRCRPVRPVPAASAAWPRGPWRDCELGVSGLSGGTGEPGGAQTHGDSRHDRRCGDRRGGPAVARGRRCVGRRAIRWQVKSETAARGHDAPLIEDARNRARALLRDDPELSGDVQLAGAVLDFTRGNETYLTSN